MDVMESFGELIERWPTVRDFAEALEVSPNTAAGWKRRESIPAAYWPRVIEAAAAQKIRLKADDLMRFASQAA